MPVTMPESAVTFARNTHFKRFFGMYHQNSVIDLHLENFRGTCVGDAAGVNARLAARSADRIRHQSCNAHARREFVKAESNAA